MDQKPVGITISWGALWKIVFMGAILVVFYLSYDVFVALFMAIVISSALHPIVSWLERHKIPRILGTLGIYIIITFLLALIVYTVVPIVLAELSTLLSKVGSVPSELLDYVNAAEFLENINKNIIEITNRLFSGTSSILDLTSQFLGSIALAISVFIFSFYLTVGKDGVERFLGSILPSEYEGIAVNLYDRVRRKIGRWLEGQIVLSLVIGTLVTLGLWFLGVKYALLLGIIAGMFELIPFVGPIFSGGSAVLIGMTDSLSTGIAVLVLFIVIQQIENNVLVPAVTKFTTALEPVAVLIALLIGVRVFGFVGLVLAVPAAVLLQEVLENWNDVKSRRKSLGL